MNKIVVFASGTGTNFQALIDASRTGKLAAAITGLIASRPQIGAIERAEKAGIPPVVISPSEYDHPEAFGSALLKQLKPWDPDLIVLAGYLIQIPNSVIRAYPGRIINIHPSLLPKYGGKGFYGMRVHEAVIEAGEKESGCTVHLVNEVYDQGPVLAQARVEINPGDTPEILAERIRKKEHELLPKVVQKQLTQKEL